MNNEKKVDKQLIAVLIFLLFIGISIFFAVKMGDKPKKETGKPATGEIVDNGTDVEPVPDSEPIVVETETPPSSNTGSNTGSNNNNNNNSNNSNNSNNKPSTSTKPNDGKIPVSSFITEVGANKIYVGGKTNIKVTINPSNATDKGVNFTSTTPNVCSVSTSGEITGVGAGDCTIAVKLDAGIGTNVSIQVIARPTSGGGTSNPTIGVTSVSLNPTSLTLEVGSSYTMSATISPSNATNKSVTWTSSNTNVATVTNGLVTAKGVGTTTITVRTADGNKTASSTVTVKNKTTGVPTIAVTGVSLNKTSATLDVGASTTITATVTPSNATNKSVSWTSSNTSVATVSGGKITAVGGGSATITVKTVDGGKTATCKVTVNGWTIDKKYYYRNGSKVKDSYVDYIYLDKDGVAQPKIGNFSATLYGAVAWSNQEINVREKPTQNSTKLGSVPTGGKVTILSAEDSSTKYIKIKYNNLTGYVNSKYLLINLPDVVPDAIYEITNANASIFKTSDISIPNVTGKNLYGYKKAYNAKINKTTYYAPLLYPVAQQFQTAYNTAVKQGYNLKVYDAYRPYSVTKSVAESFLELYNSNPTVKQNIDKDPDGGSWSPTWFFSTGISKHNRGIALDLTITNSKGTELVAQTKMHTLDTRSLRKYNNDVADTLSKIMTSAGFETLASEWWHFQEETYLSSPYTSIQIS